MLDVPAALGRDSGDVDQLGDQAIGSFVLQLIPT
jgi:hypothetical protein